VHTGYVVIPQRVSHNCDSQGQYYFTLSGFGYVDPWGTSHGFGGYLRYDPNDCYGSILSTSGTAQDGSNLQFSVSMNSNGVLNPSTITARNGNVYKPPYEAGGSATATDANGNQISVNASGVFTDTLGTTALTVSGSAPSPTKFTYTSPSGSTYYQMNYKQYTVETNFGCSNIEEYGPINNYLVDNIAAPDGSKYQFTYETNGSNVTGRIASVQLPTGGVITYSYTGANHGTECADGSTAALNRTTPDSSTPWKYSRSGSGSSWTTTVTDPQSNQTILNFEKDSSTTVTTNNFYETQRAVKQGSATLSTTITCYNGVNVGTPSSCYNTAVASPITRTTVFHYLPASSGSQAETDTTYNTNGLVQEVDDYDYGSGAVGPLIRKTITTYGTFSGGTCTNLGNSIVDRPCMVTITDSGGNTKAQTTYTYDEGSVTASGATQHISITGSRGNLTTIAALVRTGSSLYRKFTYYDTGKINQAGDISSTNALVNATTYNYSSSATSCDFAFPTSISEPLSLSRSTTWDCNGGLPVTTNDENQQPTTNSYDEMWRTSDIKYPDGGETKTTYNTTDNPPNITVNQLVDSSGDWLTTQTNLDGLGRVMQTQVTSDPGGTDYVDTTYDAVGNVYSVSNPYRIKSESTYGVTYYTYDPLGRRLTATQPDSSVVSYVYTNRATHISGLAGLNRISQIDGLGRTAYVCDGINAVQQADGKSPSACGLDIPANGFLAVYQYDPRGLLTSANYSGESRSTNYDGLGRIINSTNPETGYETWTYDTASAGMLYQHTDARSIVSTYSFDGLHRLSQISYSDGTTPTYKYYYDSQQGGGTGTYLKGRLALATTSNSSTTLAESWFGYDPMGRINSQGSCAPLVCPVSGAAWSILGFTFNYDGSVHTLSDPDVPDTLTYARNSIGQITGVTSSLYNAKLPQTLVSNVTYNALGAIVSDTSVDGYNETVGYNNMGRRTSFSAGSLYGFSLGYTSAGSVNSTVDSSMGSWTFGYDPAFFGRLTSATCLANCPNGWGTLSWTYDEYGNRWQQIVSAGQGPQPSYMFDLHNHITGSGVAYDSAGNMVNDGLGDAYTYDANSRLVNEQGDAFVFDALGNRVASTNLSSGEETDFVYAGSTLVHRNNSSAKGWGFESGYGSYYGKNTSHFFRNYTDQVSSERVQTQYSTSGPSVYESCQNLPFGDAITCQHPQGGYGGDAYYFAGLFSDGVPNDNQAMAREYTGTQGRWESPDPAGLAAVDPSNPQTWNRYAYVLNNPLSKVDPLGLDDCSPDEPDCRDPCDWDPMFCDAVWGPPGGGGGGGGSNPPSPPHNGGGGPSTPQHGPWPGNETTGLPQLPTQPLSIGDLMSFTPGAVTPDEVGLGTTICVVQPEVCVAGIITIGVIVYAPQIVDTIKQLAKGGTQNVAHDYVRDMARGMPGDYCTNLQTIMDNARKSGNSKLFNDAKATYKQDCRGR
jgi:RHS repeat-associated protein